MGLHILFEVKYWNLFPFCSVGLVWPSLSSVSEKDTVSQSFHSSKKIQSLFHTQCKQDVNQIKQALFQESEGPDILKKRVSFPGILLFLQR